MEYSMEQGHLRSIVAGRLQQAESLHYNAVLDLKIAEAWEDDVPDKQAYIDTARNTIRHHEAAIKALKEELATYPEPDPSEPQNPHESRNPHWRQGMF